MKPDVTNRVMQRLGYQQVSPQQARRMRVRALIVHCVQAATVMSALVLGAVWWFDGGVPATRQPEVVDSLRGSFTRGSHELQGFLAALPRLPQERTPDQTLVDGPQPVPGVLDSSPQLRSY